MLRQQPFWNALILNILLGTAWHTVTFLLCVYKNPAAFSPRRKIYHPRSWEREGRLYAEMLRINRWKDYLPRHNGKNGFSKEHLEGVSLEYIDRFIIETCRGEWNHSMNCLLAPVLLILNRPELGFCLAIPILIGNFPFVIIQRYNRFRLQRLRKRILRRQKRLSLQTEETGAVPPAAAVSVHKN